MDPSKALCASPAARLRPASRRPGRLAVLLSMESSEVYRALSAEPEAGSGLAVNRSPQQRSRWLAPPQWARPA